MVGCYTVRILDDVVGLYFGSVNGYGYNFSFTKEINSWARNSNGLYDCTLITYVFFMKYSLIETHQLDNSDIGNIFKSLKEMILDFFNSRGLDTLPITSCTFYSYTDPGLDYTNIPDFADGPFRHLYGRKLADNEDYIDLEW